MSIASRLMLWVVAALMLSAGVQSANAQTSRAPWLSPPTYEYFDDPDPAKRVGLKFDVFYYVHGRAEAISPSDPAFASAFDDLTCVYHLRNQNGVYLPPGHLDPNAPPRFPCNPDDLTDFPASIVVPIDQEPGSLTRAEVLTWGVQLFLSDSRGQSGDRYYFSQHALVPTLPPAPTGLVLSHVAGKVRVTWNQVDTNSAAAGGSPLEGFEVQHRFTGLDGTTMNRWRTIFNYTDTGDAEQFETAEWYGGRRNEYRVRTVNDLVRQKSEFRGLWSEVVVADGTVAANTIWHRQDVGPAPINLLARVNADGNSYIVSWDHPENYARADILEYTVIRIDEDGAERQQEIIRVETTDTDWWEDVPLQSTFSQRGVQANPTSGFRPGEGYQWVVFGTSSAPPPENRSARTAPVHFGTHPAPTVQATHSGSDSYIVARWRLNTNSSRGNSPITWRVTSWKHGEEVTSRQTREITNGESVSSATIPIEGGAGTWEIRVAAKNAAGLGPDGSTSVNVSRTSRATDSTRGISETRVAVVTLNNNVTWKLTGPNVLRPNQEGVYKLTASDTNATTGLGIGIAAWQHDATFRNIKVGWQYDNNGHFNWQNRMKWAKKWRNVCEFGAGVYHIACLRAVHSSKDRIRAHQDIRVAGNRRYSYTRYTPKNGHRHNDEIRVIASPTLGHLGITSFRIGFEPHMEVSSGAPSGLRLIFLQDRYGSQGRKCPRPHPTVSSNERYYCTNGDDPDSATVNQAHSFTVYRSLANEQPLPPGIGVTHRDNGEAVLEITPPANADDVLLQHMILERTTLVGGAERTVTQQLGTDTTSLVLPRLEHPNSSNSFAPSRLRVRGFGHTSLDDGWEAGIWSEWLVDQGAEPPEFLRAQAGNGRVRLRWGLPDNVNGVDYEHFEILWSTAAQEVLEPMAAVPSGVTVLEVNKDSTQHTISNLQNGTTYYFTMRASGPAIYRSATSAQVRISPSLEAEQPPSAPIDPVATGEQGAIALTWSPPADDGLGSITGYHIQRSEDLVVWTDLIADTENTATNYVDQSPDLLPNVQRYYQIRAINNAGAGAWSNQVTATTPITPPGPPQAVIVSVEGNDRILVAWAPPEIDGGAAITGYQVERRTSGTNTFTTILAQEENYLGTEFADTAVEDARATVYQYVVVAFNETNMGGERSILTASQPQLLPGQPTVTVMPTADTIAERVDRVVRVSWLPAPYSDLADRAEKWQVYYRASGETEWILSQEREGYATRSALVSVSGDGTYQVKVHGANQAGVGAPGESEIDITFQPREALNEITATGPTTGGGVTSSLRGPSIVAPGQIARYTLTGAHEQPIGIYAANHLVKRVSGERDEDAESDVFDISGCGFAATGTPQVHVCLRVPTGAPAYAFNPINNPRSAASYKKTGEGSPDGHVFEVWINPDEASVGAQFEIGFQPSIDGLSDPTWSGEIADSVRAENYRKRVTISFLGDRPEPPRNLRATLQNGQYVLSWDPPTNALSVGVDTYDIDGYYSANYGTANAPLFRQQLDHVQTQYVIANPQPTEPTTWQVRAKRLTAANAGAYSDPVHIGGFASPANFQQIPGDGMVRLTWAAPEGGALTTLKHYTVRRTTTAEGPTTLTEIAQVADDTLYYNDLEVENDTEYLYTVAAVDANNLVGPESNRAISTPIEGIGYRPGPPTNLTVRSVNQQYELSWSAPTDFGGSRLLGYIVEVSEDGNNYQSLDNPTDPANSRITEEVRWEVGTESYTARRHVGPAQTEYTVPLEDPPLPVATVRFFRVATLNSSADDRDPNQPNAPPPNRSDFSEPASGPLTPVVSQPPTGLRVWVRHSSRVQLEWTAPTDHVEYPVSEYEIQRRTSEGNWETLQCLEVTAGDGSNGSSEPLQPQRCLEVPAGEMFSAHDRDAPNAGIRAHTYRVRAIRRRQSGESEDNITRTSVATTDPMAEVPPVWEFDFNDDGYIDRADPSILYFYFQEPRLRDDSGDGRRLRRELLSKLTELSTAPDDATMQEWVAKAQAWVRVEGESLGGKVTQIGGGTAGSTITRTDAKVIYYVAQFPDLLGDGSEDKGYPAVREALLGPDLRVSGQPNSDAQLREVIGRAWKLLH